MFVFQELLNELVSSGKIVPGTKWKNIYPTFSNDDRYLNILGKPGSNPLELFWDVVDSLDQKLESKVAVAEAAIRRANDRLMQDGGSAEASLFKIGPDTTEAQFLEVMKADEEPEVKKLSQNELKEIFRCVSSFLFHLLVIY